MFLFNDGEYSSRVHQMFWVRQYEDGHIQTMEWIAHLVRTPAGAWVVREKWMKSDGRGIPFDPNDEEWKREREVASESAGIEFLSTGSRALTNLLGKPRKVTQLAPKTDNMQHLIFKLAKAKLVNVMKVDPDTGETVVQTSDDLVREMES